MSAAGDRLYRHLPAVVRLRDAEVGHPLRALLDIVGEQADALHADIAHGYANLFIETCDDPVVAHLAHLVGTTVLYDASRSGDDATALAAFPDLRGPRLLMSAGASARADVARTVAARRRKGTVSALDDIARYACGFPVRLVEGLARTAWTQHARHARPDLTTARAGTRLDSAPGGGPFDRSSRLVDVRRPAGPVGWYSPDAVTVAVYRQRAQSHRRTPLRPADQPWRLRLDPLGLDRPLFTRGTRAALPGPLAPAAVPARLSVPLFEADLVGSTGTVLYGPVGERVAHSGASLGLWVDGRFVPAATAVGDPPRRVAVVLSRRLDPWPDAPPEGRVVAVDVRTGRVALGAGYPPAADVTASFFHGSAGTVGGGDYDRSRWLCEPGPARVRTVGSVGADHPTVVAALGDPEGGPGRTVVRILDSRRYEVPAALHLGGRSLVIEAENGEWPVLYPGDPAAPFTVGGAGELTLSGVALAGRLVVGAGVELLRLIHTTVLPGATGGGPSITTDGDSRSLRLRAAFVVTGDLLLPQPIEELVLLDTVVVANAGPGRRAVHATGTALCCERSTFLGTVDAGAVEASDCLFAGPVAAERAQQGNLRYCYYHPEGSRTPRRFACQPDRAVADLLARRPGAADHELAAEARRVAPAFVSPRYGDPGFAQLDPDCPVEIATGAEDGGEIGAHSHVKSAHRLANLRLRLDGYLPAGTAAGIAVIT